MLEGKHHLFQFFVPNPVNLYGSASERLKLRDVRTFGGQHQDIFIKRSHEKALDQPTQRCTVDNVNANECIVRFIQGEIGCRPNIMGHEYVKGTPCTTLNQLMALANITTAFELADGNEIYEATGCLAQCENYHYSMSQGIMDGSGKFYLTLQFKIMDMTYEAREQYVIYDINSFIADVGGYMGLLLGFSLSSIYADMESFLKKFMCRANGN